MLESQGLIESRGSALFVVWPSSAIRSTSGSTCCYPSTSPTCASSTRCGKLLEGELAALAAERRTDEDLGRMLTALEEMHDGLDSAKRYINADGASISRSRLRRRIAACCT